MPEALRDKLLTVAEEDVENIDLNKLKRQLSAVQQQADVQRQSVESIKKSLAAIAVARYKSTGLGEGLELLFSSDPSLYLSAAGSLENVTRKQAIELRKYATAKQRLDATSLTVADKLRLVQAAEARRPGLRGWRGRARRCP